MPSELSVNVAAMDCTSTAVVELPDDVFNVQANIPLMHQVVVAQLAPARQPTSAAPAALPAITESREVLVVLSVEAELNWLSLRNLPTVHLIESGQLNTCDVLVAEELIFTSDALAEFLGVSGASSPVDVTG